MSRLKNPNKFIIKWDILLRKSLKYCKKYSKIIKSILKTACILIIIRYRSLLYQKKNKK